MIIIARKRGMTNEHRPDYTVCLRWGYLLLIGSVHVYTFRLVPWLETAAGLLHIALLVIFVAVLLVFQPHHLADFVFSASADTGGWDNDYVATNLGFVIVTWGFVGFDGGLHVSEDTKKAASSVIGTVWPIAVNGGLAAPRQGACGRVAEECSG